jgi:hypothetical protein
MARGSFPLSEIGEAVYCRQTTPEASHKGLGRGHYACHSGRFADDHVKGLKRNLWVKGIPYGPFL